MTVEIEVISECAAGALCSQDSLVELARFTFEEAGVEGQWAVAIVLTNDDHLQQLHRDFMGIDEPTDVMTFPYWEGADAGDLGGDIVISVDRASAQGPDNGLSTCEEVAFLTVHGLLHLSGWTDDTTERREQMLARQSEILAAFSRRRS